MVHRKTARFLFLFLSFAVAGGLIVAPPVGAASIHWINPVSGDWSDSSKWNPPQIPGPDDIAFINVAGDYTVTIDGDAEASRFTVGSSSGTQTLVLESYTLATSSGVPSTVVQGGVLQILDGGSITGTGSIINLATVEIADGIIDVSYSNQGTLNVDGASEIHGALTTNSSSVIRLNDQATLTVADGFTNDNLILLAGDASGLTITTGTLTNAPTAILLVSGSGGARSFTAELDNQGTVSVNTDLTIAKDSAQHSNSGTINCFGGNLTVTQSGSDPSFTNAGSLWISDGLAMSVTGGTLENAPGGSIAGEGTLDVGASSFTNRGVLDPGGSAGIFSITGDCTQALEGTLTIEIGGLVAGQDHDQLEVSGEAALDGTLAVTLIDGFVPEDGDTFEILTYDAHTGAFADTSSLDLGGGITLIQQYGPEALTLVATMDPDVVQPIDPETCITPADSCLTIPFAYLRMNPRDVRAYSVTFSLGPELKLCEGLSSIVEGPFLSGYCGGDCTVFQANDNLDGTYTVDATILGSNCGPDSSGTLFTVDITHTGSDGIGTVAVESVTIRDCENDDVPGVPGQPIEIGIDVEFPLIINDLAAEQVINGNDADGTTAVTITFSGDVSGDTVEIYRKGFGDYPEYDDGTGSVPDAPTTPEEAVASGWDLTAMTQSGETDEPPTRDYWYYIAFVTSPCDLQSVSNMTDGTLNYHLGDVSDGVNTCEGDNQVGTIDVSFLGAHYFKTGEDVDPVNCLDFGPTDDGTVHGLPLTDNAIDFEDLVLIGINFGEVDIPKQIATLAPASGSENEETALVLAIDGARVGPQATQAAQLLLEGNETVVKAIHAVVSYDRNRLRLLTVRQGELLQRQPGNVFFDSIDRKGEITIDATVLGRDATIIGSGELAVLEFQPLVENARPMLTATDLRDRENRSLLDGATSSIGSFPTERPEAAASLPTVTRLRGARPNPFVGTTEIAFALATATDLSVRIFDVAGRLVRTLVQGRMPAGEYLVSWDGRSDGGRTVPSGVYLYTFRTSSLEKTQKLILKR